MTTADTEMAISAMRVPLMAEDYYLARTVSTYVLSLDIGRWSMVLVQISVICIAALCAVIIMPSVVPKPGALRLIPLAAAAPFVMAALLAMKRVRKYAGSVCMLEKKPIGVVVRSGAHEWDIDAVRAVIVYDVTLETNYAYPGNRVRLLMPARFLGIMSRNDGGEDEVRWMIGFKRDQFAKGTRIGRAVAAHLGVACEHMNGEVHKLEERVFRRLSL